MLVDVNKGEDDSSDFSGEEKGMGNLQKRSPPSFPFAAGRKSRKFGSK